MSAPAITYSTSVIPQSISVAGQQGDILLQRVIGQNDVRENIWLRPVAGGFVMFDATGALVADPTPALGVATVTSVNGLTVTTTTGTLTIVNGGTLATAGAFSITLTSTATTALTLPTTGTLATLAGAETLTNKTLTAPVIGVATGTSLAVTAGLTSSGPTGAGIGYATGAGGTVTQLTDATTTVVLSKLSGTITTVSLTLAAGVDTSFTLTNSTIAATDVVVASIKSYGGTADGIPVVAVVATAAGSCVLNIRNTGAVTLDAVAVINFAVIKAVAA